MIPARPHMKRSVAAHDCARRLLLCGFVSVVGLATSSVRADADQESMLRDRIAQLEQELAEAKIALASMQSSGQDESSASVPPTEAESAPASPPAAGGIGEQLPTSPGLASRLPSWLRDWKSSVEVGLNGSDGNTSRQSLRLNLNTVRRWKHMESSVRGAYRMSSNNGERDQSQLVVDARNDWIVKDGSPWRYFATARLEYDEFQPWDARTSGFGGVGYQLLQTESTTLLGRGGFGGSRAFGLDEEFRSEAFIAADLTFSFSETQRLRAAVEYLPDTGDLNQFRLNTDASWEMKLDPKSELYLRIGVANRYDSQTHERASESDVDYFVNVGWSF